MVILCIMTSHNPASKPNSSPIDDTPSDEHALITHAFHKNEKVVRNLVVSIVGDRETADDIVQSTFVKIWNYSYSQPIRHPKALLFKTAKNLAIDELRRRSRRVEQITFSGDPVESAPVRELPSLDKSPEELVLLKQETSAILDAIEKLPSRNRWAFKQHRFHGLTYKQISKKMDVSQSCVEKYIIEALRQLRLCHKSL